MWKRVSTKMILADAKENSLVIIERNWIICFHHLLEQKMKKVGTEIKTEKLQLKEIFRELQDKVIRVE